MVSDMPFKDNLRQFIILALLGSVVNRKSGITLFFSDIYKRTKKNLHII